MFDLLDKPKVWIPVYWPGLKPSEKEGEVAEVVQHRVDILAEILENDGLKAIFDPPEGTDPPNDFDAFKMIARDWRKVVANGNPVPMTDENVRKLLNQPGFPTALQVAYLKAVNGKVEIREGNSAGSPPNGRAGESEPRA